jgi:hypothetical protein
MILVGFGNRIASRQVQVQSPKPPETLRKKETALEAVDHYQFGVVQSATLDLY